MKKIGIFGDSWAVGSYKKLQNSQEILGDITFQDLFDPQRFIVNNHSKPGGTNLDTIRILKKNSDYDLSIVFQTDPVRQCLLDSLKVDPAIYLPPSENFIELCEFLLKEFYQELEKNSGKILLIGGCTPLCLKYIPDSIMNLPMSWTELMTPGFKDNYFYWVEPTLSLYNHARKKFNWTCNLSDFVEFEEQILTKNHIWQTSADFSWCHAADPAYKKMFEMIMEKLDQRT
jgi:hypothetical protein